ncbi:MAG: agmatine deiminase family protein [Pirellulaceae bacterium]
MPSADEGSQLSAHQPQWRSRRVRTTVRPARLTGEFERQSGVLVACNELIHTAPDVFKDIVIAATSHVPVVALVNNEDDQRLAVEILTGLRLPENRLRFVKVQHNTMWARDYGPRALMQDNRLPLVIDPTYADDRPEDESVPTAIGHLAGLPVVATTLRVAGGNLLSNGTGVIVTTDRILEENPDLEQAEVIAKLAQTYEANEVVMLDPLSGESTGHVDMFATFTSPTTVVVGSYSVEEDEENAQILDRNAARLAKVVTPQGPLSVVRIPMPSNADSVWRTYTNVVFANGALLFPVYQNTDDDVERHAMELYRAVLPGWEIKPVNVDGIIDSGGALHCTVLNLGPIDIDRLSMPRLFPAGRRARFVSSLR